VDVLTDLVRSYASQATSIVPQFLAASFEMLRDGQSKAMENLTVVNPMAAMPGFEMMKAQQEAFMKAMTGGLAGSTPTSRPDSRANESADDLNDIKSQLAELQEKLSKL
jgi:polyhydroxyalkanoate synthesis regulator protein